MGSLIFTKMYGIIMRWIKRSKLTTKYVLLPITIVREKICYSNIHFISSIHNFLTNYRSAYAPEK